MTDKTKTDDEKDREELAALEQVIAESEQAIAHHTAKIERTKPRLAALKARLKEQRH
jgi:hypothetical protein